MDSGSLSSLDNLTHLGLRGGVDMRPTLLRVLTDLYVQKLSHTPDEERHYTELALRLLDAVDVATRTAVAGRLARHLLPPQRVIERLAGDLPAVAEPVRAHSRLRPGAKAETLKAAKTPAAISAPAGRHDDAPQQEEIRLDDQLRPAADLNAPIGADVASELNELFFAASANERRLILLNLEIAAPLPAGRVTLARGADIAQRLEAAALARNREDFARHLAHSLQIPHLQARRIADDDLGEPIVAAAKALTMPRDVVYRVLLFVNTTVGQSVERVHTLATLYDELPAQAAEHMVAIWQALQKAEHSERAHHPLFWNGETRQRARSATEIVRRAPSTQRPAERRNVP